MLAVLQLVYPFFKAYDTIAGIDILIVEFLYNLDDVSIVDLIAVLVVQACKLADGGFINNKPVGW